MEGDAKGQVGGMEMPEGERRRLAEESKAWRCQGCGGRTNENILKEEGGEASGSDETPAVIPEELKFGFKDEMGNGEGKGKGNDNVQIETSTGPAKNTSMSTPAVSEPPSAVPVPATTALAAGPPGTSSAQMPQRQPSSTHPITTPPSNGSPAWLDKVITGVAAALVVMVIKKVILSL